MIQMHKLKINGVRNSVSLSALKMTQTEIISFVNLYAYYGDRTYW